MRAGAFLPNQAARPPLRGRGQRLLGILVFGYGFGVLGCAAVLWIGGDVWWPGTLLLFGPRWVIGLPFFLLVPASLWAGRRLWLPLAVAALVFVFPFMGLELPNVFAGNSVGASVGIGGRASEGIDEWLRIVSLNVAHGRGLESSLQDLVAQWDADVIALQECGGVVERQVGTVEGYEGHVYGGLCLLSRFPILSAEGMNRQSFEAAGGAGWAIRYGLLTPGGDTLNLMNLHLGTPREGLWEIRYGSFADGVAALRRSRALRRAEAERARAWLDETSGNRIALGDFNAPVESRIYRAYWDDLINAFDRAGLGLGHTRYNGWIRARIDHLLTDGSWIPTSVVVGSDVGSDHRPLLVVLRRSDS